MQRQARKGHVALRGLDVAPGDGPVKGERAARRRRGHVVPEPGGSYLRDSWVRGVVIDVGDKVAILNVLV